MSQITIGVIAWAVRKTYSTCVHEIYHKSRASSPLPSLDQSLPFFAFFKDTSSSSQYCHLFPVENGSVEAYLTEAVGLRPEIIQRLRDNLLDP
jgi:hypothetical protein